MLSVAARSRSCGGQRLRPAATADRWFGEALAVPSTPPWRARSAGGAPRCAGYSSGVSVILVSAANVAVVKTSFFVMVVFFVGPARPAKKKGRLRLETALMPGDEVRGSPAPVSDGASRRRTTAGADAAASR